MYVKRVEAENFRCFENIDVAFHYPGRDFGSAKQPELSNLTLVLGDNGAGKSSLLKAMAVGILGTVLPSAGFRPLELVRSHSPMAITGKQSEIKVHVQLEDNERYLMDSKADESLEYLFRTVLKKKPSGDVIEPESTHLYIGAGPAPVPDKLYENEDPAFFLCGYGSSRRSEESSTYDESTRSKSRALRYQRIASLFEEGFTLTSFSPWLSRMTSDKGEVHAHWNETALLLGRLLEMTDIKYDNSFINGEAAFAMNNDKVKVLYSSLSDGYRAYLSWLGDLLRHLCTVTPSDKRLVDTPGLVVVDEVDLHLHPSWQRRILWDLSRIFPKLQFIVTSHSPILAASVPRENVLIVERTSDGPAEVVWSDRDYYGRSMDEVLTGDYFELTTTLPPELERKHNEAEERRSRLARELARAPSPEATDAYLEELTARWSE